MPIPPAYVRFLYSDADIVRRTDVWLVRCAWLPRGERCLRWWQYPGKEDLGPHSVPGQLHNPLACWPASSEYVHVQRPQESRHYWVTSTSYPLQSPHPTVGDVGPVSTMRSACACVADPRTG